MGRDDAARDEGRGEGFDGEVCGDVTGRRSWVPVEAPVRRREREREHELVRGPGGEDAGCGECERGGRDG